MKFKKKLDGGDTEVQKRDDFSQKRYIYIRLNQQNLSPKIDYDVAGKRKQKKATDFINSAR